MSSEARVSDQRTADRLAEAAVAGVKSGMIVGLGTGRTAQRGVVALADRVRAEGLEVRCVPTSHATATVARAHGLTMLDFEMLERVDYLFDGADEADARLRVLKGSGGAFARERIVAWAAGHRVYMVSGDKLVDRLGSKNTLAVAVLAFGLSAVRAELRNLGLNGVCRRTIDGELFMTDSGNLVLDVTLADQDLEELSASLNDVPGVIDHGLFLTEADEVLVETASGEIRRMTRPNGRR